jgi:hypothetical protein
MRNSRRGRDLQEQQAEMKARLTRTNPPRESNDLPDSLSRVVAHVEGLIDANKKLMDTNSKLMEATRLKKFLLTPQEAAASLGFTLKAFNQAAWHNQIPVKKVGIKSRFRPEDLKVFADNLPTTYPQFTPGKLGRAA